MSLRSDLESELQTSIRVLTPRAGGDAASAFTCETADGDRWFVKTVARGAPFAMEALGLERLNVADGVRVPRVRAVGDTFLVLELLELGRPGADIPEEMGRRLAHTHLATRHDAYGFDADHWIGATPQKNQPWRPHARGAWAEFWWTHRLEPMLRRLGDPELSALGDRLADRLPDLLGLDTEPPCLIHGDLWSGNVSVDSRGAPVMFDPAPSYSRREAELGMTRLFGGFPEAFYRAYCEVAPLEAGWEERLDLYTLYHVLNHAVLFGGGYAEQARSLMRRHV